MGGTIRALAVCLVLVATPAALARGIAQADARPGVPRHFLANAPGATFYPDSRPGLYPPHGQVTAVPAYPWGFFGARSKPFLVNQRGYYGDYRQTVFPRQ